MFFAQGLHVNIAAEHMLQIGPFSVSNSMLMGVAGYIFTLVVLLGVAWRVRKNKKRGFFTRLILWCFEGLRNTVYEVIDDKRIAKMILPFAITIFFFVAFQYYFGILPFVGPITWDGAPLLRGQAADLNMTFALAIMTIVMVQFYAVKKFGFFGNIKRYIRNPFRDPIGAFEGLLEIIAEFSRLVALSMRLFGNVFAGEVLLLVIGWMTKYVSPLALPPFYIFELFIGGIQAYIFFMLTVVFTGLAVAGHGDTSSDHSPADSKIPEEIPSAASGELVQVNK